MLTRCGWAPGPYPWETSPATPMRSRVSALTISRSQYRIGPYTADLVACLNSLWARSQARRSSHVAREGYAMSLTRTHRFWTIETHGIQGISRAFLLAAGVGTRLK